MLLAALLLATSTLCHYTPVEVPGTSVTDRLLDGCGGANSENLLWHLDRADGTALNGVATRGATGKGVVVYVCDTGVRASHDEFARESGGAVIAGLDAWQDKAVCPGGDNDAINPCGSVILFSHGTAVASVIAGKNTGLAPDAKLVSVRTMGDEKASIKGMHLIIQHAFAPTTPPFTTAIINMSASVSTKPSPEFEALMRKMILGVDANENPDPDGRHFLFVVAAGNAVPFTSNGDPAQCAKDFSVILTPAYLGRDTDGLVAVGGLDRTNSLWKGSCYGYAVDVLAPAEEMFVASMSGNDRYRYLPIDQISGTSYATPYVSGMAARMLEFDPTLTPVQLEQKLKSSPSIVLGLPVPMDPAPAPDRRRALR